MRTIAGTDSAEQLRRVQSVSDAALAHLELADLLDELLVRIQEALAADTAAFLLLDEETDELVARAARGLEEEVERGTRIPVGAGFAGRVAADRRPLAIADVDHADILNPILREKGVKSLLGAPLVVHGRVIGVVHVGTLTPRAFTPEDAQLLQLVADRAALAIDHGRTYEAERALAERLQRLQAVTDVTLEHLSTGDLLEELVLRVRDILNADTCAILLLDEEAGDLVARAAAGLEEEVEQQVRIPLGRGFAGRIAEERRPVALERIDSSNVLNPILRERLTSVLGAPLLSRGRLLGVIHVGSVEERVFAREEVELLQRAAERAALGLEHALVHQRLIELDRVRNRFVAIASHELRTPTTAILGSAATLEARKGELDAEQEEELRRILAEQSRRLATLVEQLLDLSRLETHAVEITPVRRRARELVEHALAHVAVDQRVHVRIEIDPELELDVDPVAFDRVLSNLLVNALRHGAPPVVVSAAPHGNGVRFVVEDAGAGVPEDVRGRIFDEFARSEHAAGRPGSGLGLAIARSYAHAHGGELLLDESAERGARFELVLPGPRP
jgi:signal transduction histidine kinase